MGGRGASSGRSKGTANNPEGNKYGTQYKTINVKGTGNIKFIEKATAKEPETLMETMTRGRVYVIVAKDKLKKIVYFDNNNKRSKTIDLDHSHQKMRPHTHHGYKHTETEKSKIGASKLTTKEREMVARVTKLWYNHLNGI